MQNQTICSWDISQGQNFKKGSKLNYTEGICIKSKVYNCFSANGYKLVKDLQCKEVHYDWKRKIRTGTNKVDIFFKYEPLLWKPQLTTGTPQYDCCWIVILLDRSLHIFATFDSFFFITGVLYVATEFAQHGNLLNLLRQSRCLETDPTYANNTNTVSTLSQEQLLRFAADVALGMQHLAEKGVINKIIKISKWLQMLCSTAYTYCNVRILYCPTKVSEQ